MLFGNNPKIFKNTFYEKTFLIKVVGHQGITLINFKFNQFGAEPTELEHHHANGHVARPHRGLGQNIKSKDAIEWNFRLQATLDFISKSGKCLEMTQKCVLSIFN